MFNIMKDSKQTSSPLSLVSEAVQPNLSSSEYSATYLDQVHPRMQDAHRSFACTKRSLTLGDGFRLTLRKGISIPHSR